MWLLSSPLPRLSRFRNSDGLVISWRNITSFYHEDLETTVPVHYYRVFVQSEESHYILEDWIDNEGRCTMYTLTKAEWDDVPLKVALFVVPLYWYDGAYWEAAGRGWAAESDILTNWQESIGAPSNISVDNENRAFLDRGPEEDARTIIEWQRNDQSPPSGVSELDYNKTSRNFFFRALVGSESYSGVPGNTRRVMRWPNGDVKYRIFFGSDVQAWDPDAEVWLTGSDAEDYYIDAMIDFSSWVNNNLDGINLVVTTELDHDISVQIGRGTELDISAYGTASVSIYTSTGYIASAVLKVRWDHSYDYWAGRSQRATLCHELGHGLGIRNDTVIFNNTVLNGTTYLPNDSNRVQDFDVLDQQVLIALYNSGIINVGMSENELADSINSVCEQNVGMDTDLQLRDLTAGVEYFIEAYSHLQNSIGYGSRDRHAVSGPSSGIVFTASEYDSTLELPTNVELWQPSSLELKVSMTYQWNPNADSHDIAIYRPDLDEFDFFFDITANNYPESNFDYAIPWTIDTHEPGQDDHWVHSYVRAKRGEAEATEWLQLDPVGVYLIERPEGLSFGTPPRIDLGMNFEWDAVTQWHQGYEFRLSIPDEQYEVYHNFLVIGSGNTTFTIQGSPLEYGTTYFASVAAFLYTDVIGDHSEFVQATTAPKTPTITASSLDSQNSRVSITIGGMEGGYTFFRIWYRNVTDNGGWNNKEVYSTGSYWIENLDVGKEYEFKVSSFYTINEVDLESRDSDGNIGYSDSIFYTITDAYKMAKVYLNGNWVEKPVKYHNGTTWVQGSIKHDF